jgi:hypothetical protein
MTANTDLITGLCEVVVLGEVVSRLCRWNKRKLLSILNRTWMKVMTKRFPIYGVAFHNIPNIQSNALILSHIKRTSGEEASYKLAGLWVCRPDNNNANICEGAITVWLPEHTLLKVRKYTKFVCDNHRVFSLTPSVVTKEPKVRQNIYNGSPKDPGLLQPNSRSPESQNPEKAFRGIGIDIFRVSVFLRDRELVDFLHRKVPNRETPKRNSEK